MRVLLTTPTYPPLNTGLGNAVAMQAKFLHLAGHEVVVATGGAARGSMMNEGIQIETFAVTGADSFLQPLKGEIPSYVDFLRRHNSQVVVLNAWQNWATDIALRHINLIAGQKYLYSHCVSTNVLYPHQPFRSILRYLAWRPYWWHLPCYMKRLDGLIFLANEGSDSRFDDLQIARRHGVPLRIVPNSLSPAAAANLDKPKLSLKERNRLIAVGSYHWQKGFDFVLRAYAASHARQMFTLHLYGQENTSFSAELRGLAHQLGLPKGSVVFHEGVAGEALQSAYDKAYLVLSGSHTECQPLALLDASAAGTPFIARSTGCIASMPGGINVSSWKAMAHMVDGLVGNLPAWQALSDAALQAAKETYHPDQNAQLLLNALSELAFNRA
jgi:1,2-diacylglycerol 3-alpha-glucosyltransferase